HPRAPHSFPTRRSSDLSVRHRGSGGRHWVCGRGPVHRKKAGSCSPYSATWWPGASAAFCFSASTRRRLCSLHLSNAGGRDRCRRSEEHTSELQSREKLV